MHVYGQMKINVTNSKLQWISLDIHGGIFYTQHCFNRRGRIYHLCFELKRLPQ